MAKINGTKGDDYLNGTDSADVMIGRQGYDTLYGGGGNDRLVGGGGLDRLWGGDGRDTLLGGGSNDVLRGEAGNDVADGGAQGDSLYGGDGDDTLFGGAGQDYVRGEAGNDVLSGDEGDDFVFGGDGVDQLDGGAGIDVVSYFDPLVRQGVSVDLGSGLVANDGFGHVETITGFESVTGSLNADTLIGNDGANRIVAGAGDVASGLDGDDIFDVTSIAGATFDGGTGSDTLAFRGLDYHVGANGQFVTDYADQDIVVSLSKQTVANDGFGFSAAIAGFENVSTADGNDTINGNVRANHLIGGYGDDSLAGAGGDDILSGGFGADTLNGGAGADIFGYGIDGEFMYTSGVDGTDTILDFSSEDKLDIIPNGVPLTFIGTADFGDQGRAIRYELQGGDTFVYARSYVGIDQFEMTVKLKGIHHLSANDFLDLRSPSAPPLAVEHEALLPAMHLADLAMLP